MCDLLITRVIRELLMQGQKLRTTLDIVNQVTLKDRAKQLGFPGVLDPPCDLRHFVSRTFNIDDAIPGDHPGQKIRRLA